ncbi:MAG: DMT family transporter [Clostridiales bacterium]|nr:DMT family transporter [Clostridiales bacterium]
MKNDFIKNSGLSLATGIMIAIMVTANGMLANIMGTWIALVLIHMLGLLIAGLVLIIKKSTNNITKGVPLGYLMGGAAGVITVLLNNFCVNNIGVAMTLGLALVGQIIASAIVEHFGVLGMKKNKISLKKTPAYLLMIAGSIIMIVWS